MRHIYIYREKIIHSEGITLFHSTHYDHMRQRYIERRLLTAKASLCSSPLYITIWDKFIYGQDYSQWRHHSVPVHSLWPHDTKIYRERAKITHREGITLFQVLSMTTRDKYIEREDYSLRVKASLSFSPLSMTTWDKDIYREKITHIDGIALFQSTLYDHMRQIYIERECYSQ